MTHYPFPIGWQSMTGDYSRAWSKVEWQYFFRSENFCLMKDVASKIAGHDLDVKELPFQEFRFVFIHTTGLIHLTFLLEIGLIGLSIKRVHRVSPTLRNLAQDFEVNIWSHNIFFSKQVNSCSFVSMPSGLDPEENVKLILLNDQFRNLLGSKTWSSSKSRARWQLGCPSK